MPRAGDLLLIRHGQSTWNAEARWQGWADPPLSVEGEGQAHAAGKQLASLLHFAGVTVGAVVSSDLGRARRTAELIAAELGIGTVEVVEALRERDVGHWSGLTTEEIDAQWPGQLAAWRAGELPAIPGGEGDISARIMPAVEALAREAAGAGWAIVAVSHGGVITAMERAIGAEPSRPRNLGGRWLRWHEAPGADGRLVAGDVARLLDPGEPASATQAL